MAVDFGVFVPQGWRMDLVEIEDPFEQYEAMARVAKVAEGTGAYDSIWVYDHFHTVPEPTRETTFECWTITAGLSRDTQEIRSDRWSPATATATPRSWPRFPQP
jgi:alkanesulfonate monooxygenase SsuD/methylene tetrahydromethanopterin reductase-like flavin-dependent oxidoreductase (luciferase family)